MKQRSFRRFSTYCLSLGLGMLSLGTRLHAGNLEKFALGEDAGLSAGAVAATTADSGSLYYNPAGLARLSKDSVDLGVSAYAARFFHIPRLLQVRLPDREVAMDFEGTAFFSTPAAVIFGLRLDEGLGLGLAVFTRDQLDLTGRLSERFTGMNGAQAYEYEQGMELDFRFKNYLAGLGMGWAPWPGRLNLGLSVLGEYGRQSVSTQFWGDYRDPNSYNAGTQLYGTRLTTTYKQAFGVSSYGARAIAGLQWNVAGPLQLGLVARSPRFAVYNEVEADIILDGNFVPANAVVRVHVNGDGAQHPYIWEDPWRLEGAIALKGELGWIAAQVDANDRPDDEGRGARWNYKLGGILHLSPSWDWGAGAYTDLSWGEAPQGFGGSDMDYYGAHSGLRWKRLIGGSGSEPGRVELSTSLIVRYERGYGALNGADIDAIDPDFPLGSAPTAAVFEEANALLTSGLAW